MVRGPGTFASPHHQDNPRVVKNGQGKDKVFERKRPACQGSGIDEKARGSVSIKEGFYTATTGNSSRSEAAQMWGDEKGMSYQSIALPAQLDSCSGFTARCREPSRAISRWFILAKLEETSSEASCHLVRLETVSFFSLSTTPIQLPRRSARSSGPKIRSAS